MRQARCFIQHAHVAHRVNRGEQIDDAGTEQNPGRERCNPDIAIEKFDVAVDAEGKRDNTGKNSDGGGKVDGFGHGRVLDQQRDQCRRQRG